VKLDRFVQRFPAGAVIFRQGEPGRDVFIIQSGQVVITHRGSGKDRRLALLEKGDFFGEMALLEEYPERSASALALSDVEALQLSGSDFEDLVKSKPRVALRMMAKLSERLRESNRRLAELQESSQPLEAMPPLPSSQGIETWAVLVHEPSGRVFPLRPVGDTTVGRHDPVTGVTPDVDLSGIDPDRAVSRRHVMIRSLDGGLTLTELSARTNGTFVNGTRLEPFAPQALGDGDSLQLAVIALRLRVLNGAG
jgi:CRP-like cAMP-binding protein